ncbi:MAG TPA: DUF192 domain-containing protein [Candidatus Nanoarchaeia archaeon]|nr:DUF192 domain-containing protein [Candidatus Nanoarchaeia archaeon]
MKKEVPIIFSVIGIVLLLMILGFVVSYSAQKSQNKTETLLPVAQPVQKTEKKSGYETATLRVGSKDVIVDLADDPAKRTRGLSGRTSLETGTGMLFIFEKSGTYGFWMKDMNFSIDILWLDETGKIVHIEKSLSPDTYPKTVTPASPAKYVLELPAGFSHSENIQVGDTIVLPKW